MTTLISWVGVDSRSPSSVYLASDSRLTWPNGATWDFGRKLFASARMPELFGYCGEVLFPSQVLGQLTTIIDHGLLFDEDAEPSLKIRRVRDYLESALAAYPLPNPFSVLYVTRENQGMDLKFHVLKITWNRRWNLTPVVVPKDKSSILVAEGSGASNFEDHLDRWRKSDVTGTSRAIFAAFSDSLRSPNDPATGGAPQLVGLHRVGGGITFGVIYGGAAHMHGFSVPLTKATPEAQWRNELFEVCDGETLQRMLGAQPQPRPRPLPGVNG